jgi:hypothetical protein
MTDINYYDITCLQSLAENDEIEDWEEGWMMGFITTEI